MSVINRLQLKWEEKHPDVTFTEIFPFKITYKIGNKEQESITGHVENLEKPIILIHQNGDGVVLYTNFIKSIERIKTPAKKKSVFSYLPRIYPLYHNDVFLKITMTNNDILEGYSPLFDGVIAIKTESHCTGIHSRVISKIEQVKSTIK